MIIAINGKNLQSRNQKEKIRFHLGDNWVTPLWTTRSYLKKNCEKLLTEYEDLLENASSESAELFYKKFLSPLRDALEAVESMLLDAIAASPEDLLMKTELLDCCLEEGSAPADIIERYTQALHFSINEEVPKFLLAECIK